MVDTRAECYSQSLETAKAFDAPLLQHLGNNLNGRQIAAKEDERKAQYGMMTETTSDYPWGRAGEKMVITESTLVSKPVGKRLGVFEIISRWKEAGKCRRKGRGAATSDEKSCSTSTV